MAVITECAGLVVATVRVMVRDLIAIAFSRAVTYVTEEVFSLGFATPVVAAQLGTLVLQCAARITRLLHGVVTSLARLFETAGRLARHIDELQELLRRLHRSNSSHGNSSGGDPTSVAHPQPPSSYTGMSEAGLITGRGANVGRPGSGPKIREVATERELQEYFDALTRNGCTDITPPGFPGRMVELPDGTIVNWRTRSKTTGSVPTVDVNPGNGQSFKVHVNSNGW